MPSTRRGVGSYTMSCTDLRVEPYPLFTHALRYVLGAWCYLRTMTDLK